MKATSMRARLRAEMTDEIKTIARRHLATDGANLSLRAVARDLGVVSSAIYRYFPSRDELLTALILDAYNALGASVEAAEAAEDRRHLIGRFLAVCHAVRDWARANPHEYALIYGSPVPGYAAPTDTVAAATRAVRVFCGVFEDAAHLGLLHRAEVLPMTLTEDMARIGEVMAPSVPLPALARALGTWLQLFGFVSFELFGQLNNTVDEPGPFFDHQMRAQALYNGLPDV
ncbi:TetR/AcrR family transcriptional regulator [Asanoa sp. WMMD1127]|uniref:TetR/AcrR family transcriptional regulator n=1 Tax=Asanoa sp. WMMD1127 TaxID=3016107 RepID=UPI0024162521|nr:TetR/AcrR family transcriptional regulator [Asanoa sp. WMMD1127]MDG4821466.1 TetR/AcrR family transcriptional regulator [Asanoa sp. WMMD1127]